MKMIAMIAVMLVLGVCAVSEACNGTGLGRRLLHPFQARQARLNQSVVVEQNTFRVSIPRRAAGCSAQMQAAPAGCSAGCAGQPMQMKAAPLAR